MRSLVVLIYLILGLASILVVPKYLNRASLVKPDIFNAFKLAIVNPALQQTSYLIN